MLDVSIKLLMAAGVLFSIQIVLSVLVFKFNEMRKLQLIGMAIFVLGGIGIIALIGAIAFAVYYVIGGV